MQIKRFKVAPFSTHRFGRGNTLLYTAKGAFLVEHKGMARILGDLAARSGAPIELAKLSEMILEEDLRTTAAMKYLRDQTGVLSPQAPTSRDFKSLVLISDNEHVARALREHFEDRCGIPVISLRKPARVERDSLVVTYFEHYQEETIRTLYELNGDNNAIFLTSYLLGNYFFIDNFHIKGSGTPCHFCNLGWLKANEATATAGASNSFFYFYNYILQNKLPMRPSLPISEVDRRHLVYLIKNRTTQVLSGVAGSIATEDLNLNLRLNVGSGELTRDLVTHWEYCTCFN